MSKKQILVLLMLVSSAIAVQADPAVQPQYSQQPNGQAYYVQETPIYGRNYNPELVPAQSVQDNGYYQNANQFPQPQYYSQPQNVNAYATPLQGNVIMIPAQTVIPCVTSTAYSTENITLGQQFALTLPSGFYYGTQQIAPEGSIVYGTVIDVKKAGRATRNAMLQVKFTAISTPYGQTIPISGKFKTEDGSGILYGGTKMTTAKEYAKDTAIGAAGGAVVGTVMGALSGGKVGKGAAYGTAVGAGAGVAKSLWDKGGEIVIPANSAIDVVLEQPATYVPVQYH